jgi:O-antigen/teichoic acid export membrane protein
MSSRTSYTLKNLIANGINVLLTVTLAFVVRTVFINVLGKEYLGITGLFNNIFSILALAELGIGSAIAYKLYKPLAEHDHQRTRVLMKFYKKAYQIISLVILVLGLLTMPFLNFIIKDDVRFVNIYIVYAIFLFQSISTYMFFAYKSTLIKADQREYVTVVIGYFVEIISSITQIIILIVFENYITYIASLIFFNIIKNILIARRVDKDYAYIKEKTTETLPKKELKEMFKDFRALFLYKANSVVLTATDNIIISTYIGLATVGLYSNYLLITTGLRRIINTFYNAVKASIGNLYATSDKEHTYFIFRVINIFTVILFGGASIGIYALSNTFIHYWIGKHYIISQTFSLLLALEFYLKGLQLLLSQFRTSMGLFQQAKYRPIFSMIINLVVSLILVQYIGVYGVIIGTIISSLSTYMWFDPIIIHKYGFNRKATKYFIQNIYYLLITFIAGYTSYYVISLITLERYYILFTKIIICVVITAIIYSVFLFRSKEAKYLLKIIKQIITSKRKAFKERRNLEEANE